MTRTSRPANEDDAADVSDDELLDELRALAAAGKRYPATAASPGASPIVRDNIQTATDRYEIIREIQRGGQGVVFEAVQRASGRRVAIKVLIGGVFSSDRSRRRFEREVDLLAAINHPGIVTLYDSGELDGQPFYAMEFIDGEPVHRSPQFRMPDASASSAARRGHVERVMRFVAAACNAVAAFHRSGLVHRDLKPDNILIDEDGAPHIVDFGLARSMEAAAERDNTPAFTRTGEFLGTPAYASPEQALGSSGCVDVRSDVYSLGVIAFDLLTGRLPHQDTGSVIEVLRRIAEEAPPKPSKLNSAIDSDVETIVLKALSKEPGRRYRSVDELADDISRWLTNRPIMARSDSTFYVLRKTLRRHKLAVGVTAFVMLTLLVSSIVMFQFWRNAVSEREGAEFENYISSLYAAEGAVAEHRTLDALDMLQRPPAALRGWEWTYVLSRIDHSLETWHTGQHIDSLKAWAASKDRRWVVMAGGQAAMYVMDLESQGRTVSAQNVPIASHFAIDFTNSVIYAGHEDGRVLVYDLQSAALIREGVTLGRRITSLAVSPDGSRYFVCTVPPQQSPSEFAIVDAATDNTIANVELKSVVQSLAAHPDGMTVALGSESIELRDALSGSLIRVLDPEPAQAVIQRGRRVSVSNEGVRLLTDLQFSDDGSLLASASDHGIVNVQDLNHPDHVVCLHGHDSAVTRVGFRDDGARIVTGAQDGVVRIWSLPNGRLLREFHGHIGWVQGVVYGADGKRVLSSDTRTNVKVFNPDAPQSDLTVPVHQTAIMDLAFSPDGSTVATASYDGTIRLTSVLDGRVIQTLRGHDQSVNCVKYGFSGSRLVTGSDDRTVRIWDPDNETCEVLTGDQSAVRSVAIRHDDTFIVAGAQDGGVRLWSTADAGAARKVAQHDSPVRFVGFTPDGQRIISESAATLVVSDVAAGRETKRIPKPVLRHYSACALIHGGRHVVVGEDRSRLVLWNLDSSAMEGAFEWHQMGVSAACVSPDEQRLVSAGPDGSLKVWDIERRAEVFRLPKSSSFANALAFSPDGLRIAAGRYDGVLVFYEAVPPAERLLRNVESYE